MDNQTHNQPIPEPQKPVAAPVMDIKPPTNDSRPHTPPIQQMDAPTDQMAKHGEDHVDKIEKPDKTNPSGVGGAIFATIFIVLALACMATYAYLKTANK